MEQVIDQPNELFEASHDFMQGFNNSYLIASYEPELLADIIPSVNPDNDYFRGFFSGKEQWEREQERNQLNELEKIRNRSSDQEHDLERGV